MVIHCQIYNAPPTIAPVPKTFVPLGGGVVSLRVHYFTTSSVVSLPSLIVIAYRLRPAPFDDEKGAQAAFSIFRGMATNLTLIGLCFYFTREKYHRKTIMRRE
jgi:hypothetical protein